MKPRVSILGLMGVIALVAVATVALREANDLWASCLFTLTLFLLGLACLGGVFCRGRSRAFCAGFAAFGVGYLAVCYGPWAKSEVGPHLATTRLLNWAGPRVMRNSKSWAAGLYTVLVEGKGASSSPATLDTFQPEVFLLSGNAVIPGGGATDSFLRVGHSIFALLAALIGGMAARHFRDSAGSP